MDVHSAEVTAARMAVRMVGRTAAQMVERWAVARASRRAGK
jgi:hypothetical protein